MSIADHSLSEAAGKSLIQGISFLFAIRRRVGENSSPPVGGTAAEPQRNGDWLGQVPFSVAARGTVSPLPYKVLPLDSGILLAPAVTLA